MTKQKGTRVQVICDKVDTPIVSDEYGSAIANGNCKLHLFNGDKEIGVWEVSTVGVAPRDPKH